MTARKARYAQCYRCVYTWRVRKPGKPQICPRCKSRLWAVPKLVPVTLGHGLGVDEVIGHHRMELLQVGKRLGAERIRVFGSVRRREAGPKSDLDLLVDWKPRTGLLEIARFRIEVRKLLSRNVDVVEEGRLHWAVRPQVVYEAVTL
jgi:uncharacterized protein